MGKFRLKRNFSAKISFFMPELNEKLLNSVQKNSLAGENSKIKLYDFDDFNEYLNSYKVLSADGKTRILNAWIDARNSKMYILSIHNS